MAVLVAVSAPGLWLARWLLRPLPPLARDAMIEAFEPDDAPGLQFGGGYGGLY